MPLEPEAALGLVAGLATGACSSCSQLRVFTPRLGAAAWPPSWPGDEVFFVDASAVTARTAGGEASLVKLAILHRRPSGLWERLYAPAVAGSKAPPVLYVPRGERVRQALVYVVELASLLALARIQSISGAGLGARRVLVRHGPLVQQLAHYYSAAYDVREEEAKAALRYAGLDMSTTLVLVNDSRVTQPLGHVNLGLLASLLLEEIAREAQRSKGNLLFAGVVENTGRSRVLAADLLADATIELTRAYKPQTPQDLASAIAATINQWYASYNQRRGVSLQNCLCGAQGATAFQNLSASHVASEYAAPLQSELQTRFNTSLLGGSTAPSDKVAAALSSSNALPDITDSELLYNLVYLEDCSPLGGPPCSYTEPRSRAPVAVWAELSLQQKKNRMPQTLQTTRITAPPRRVHYTYMLVETPPDCIQLMQRGNQLGLGSPCELANLVTVPPAIRVEWMTPASNTMLSQLLTALREASRLVLYGYPPQLLVVDKASRVTWSEYTSLEILAEELAKRRQPYRSFLRGWETRTAIAWQP